MKKSLCITTDDVGINIPLALLKGTCKEKIEKAKLFGYDAVELLPAVPASINLIELKENLINNNIKVSAIGSGAIRNVCGLTLIAPGKDERNAAIKRLNELIYLASDIEAPVVTVGNFRGRIDNSGEEDGKKILLDILDQASDIALKQGVRIALEPINRYETDFLFTAIETLEFIKNINKKNLGILLDTFHINIEENSFTECFFQADKEKKLFHVHIGSNNRLPPGRGHIDFRIIMDTLKTIKYKGYISAELLTKTSPDETAIETIKYLNMYA